MSPTPAAPASSHRNRKPRGLFLRSLLAVALFGIAATTAAVSADDDDKINMSGDWAGEIDLITEQITVLFRVKEAPSGGINATVSAPQKSELPIPVDLFTRKDREVTIVVKSIKGRFSGKLNAKGDRIRGDWTTGDFTIGLDLERIEGGFAQERPQTPKEPYPYTVEEVSFGNRFANNRLAGTLTLPKDKPRSGLPCVVLVSDAGPHDRDAEASNHRPFAVLADYLTRRGIAVLRYDDRGIGASTGSFEFGTTRDFATDAWAAVDFLSKSSEIDTTRIGIIGHGEGALIAAMVEEQRDDINFIVMLAGPALRGDATLSAQIEALAVAGGVGEATRGLLAEFTSALYALFIDDPAAAAAKAQALGKELEKRVAALPPGDAARLVEVGLVIDRQVKSLESPWFARFVALDAGPGIERLRCSVLALNGANDLEVPAGVHLPAIEALLKKRGDATHEVRKLSGLNHRFQKTDNGAPSLYGTLDETFATSAMKIVADWIEKQVE